MARPRRIRKRRKKTDKSHLDRTPPFAMPREAIGILAEAAQKERIEKLKQEAAELAGGQMACWENEALPLDVQEQFWRNVVAFEAGADDGESFFVPMEVLKVDGVEFPPADELDDEALRQKLWEVIHAMARHRWYLFHTDHLSDRELYVTLLEELLADETMDVPEANLVIDAIGGYGPEDITVALKYYSDEEMRRDWAKSFPEDEIPEAEDPPYDRDRRLPSWEPSGRSSSAEDGVELVM